MDEKTQKIIDDLEHAGSKARARSKSVEQALRAHKPVPVVNGEEKPQTITFKRRRHVGHMD